VCKGIVEMFEPPVPQDADGLGRYSMVETQQLVKKRTRARVRHSRGGCGTCK
jgi:hypothetical protein